MTVWIQLTTKAKKQATTTTVEMLREGLCVDNNVMKSICFPPLRCVALLFPSIQGCPPH